VMSREESRGCQASPAHHRSESRLSIPRRVALQRSSSPLPQPSSILTRTAETVHNKSANGSVQHCRLFHFWGAPHSVQRSNCRLVVGAVRLVEEEGRSGFSHKGRVHRTTFLLFTVLGTVAAETISDGDRAYLLSHLEMTREFVVDTTRGLSKEQWLYQPGPARWSIAQCIDHLAQTEEYLLKVVRERIIPSKEPLVGTFPSMMTDRQRVADQPKRMSRIEDSFVLRWMTDRTPSAATPVEQRPPIEEVAPRRVIDDPQSALEHFRHTRAATMTYVRTTQDDLRGHFSQSPMAGFPDMHFSDAYQWLLRMSAHTERHLMQVHEVRRSAGYPRSQ
jgi:hypothetical protein